MKKFTINLSEKELIELYKFLKRSGEDELVDVNEKMMQTILKKAEKELPEARLKEIEKQLIHEKYNVEFWVEHEVPKSVYNAIEQAVKKHRAIDAKYYSLNQNDITERMIDPYGIRYKYLVGYCHKRKSIRSFRIDRFIEAKLTDKKFKVPKDFNIKEFVS